MNMKIIKSDKEHKYTSTGIKFWKHPNQMNEFKDDGKNTIISTHISPEGSCNLNCSYCSVKKRSKTHRIELNTIKDYIEKLMTRGLKAVIITGGGEPLLYPHINELTQWIKEKGLSLALITNGTCTDKLDDWSVFSWVRVSINEIPNWKERISLPVDKISKDTTIGCSYIIDTDRLIEIKDDLSFMLDKLNAEYLRLLPNCLLGREELINEHKKLQTIFKEYELDERFFHQFKVHGTPPQDTCYQSYFRPYLSEFDGGTVYPCDSLVLNENVEYFHEKYRLCKSEDILKFIDKETQPNFKPCNDCSGCVFHENIQMLDDWKNGNVNLLNKYEGENLTHAEFV